MLVLPLLFVISALCPATAFSYRDLKSRADWSDLAFVASATEHPSTQWRYWYDGPRYGCVILKAEGKKEGYQFGDITKGLAKGLIGKRVEKLTGKPYEFGDFSRKVDQSIKDRVNDLTGSDDYEVSMHLLSPSSSSELDILLSWSPHFAVWRPEQMGGRTDQVQGERVHWRGVV